MKPKTYILRSNIMNLPKEIIGNIIDYMPGPTLTKNDNVIMDSYIRLQHDK